MILLLIQIKIDEIRIDSASSEKRDDDSEYCIEVRIQNYCKLTGQSKA
jgi:hypothetical protein